VGYYGFTVDATGKYTVGSDLTSHPARVRQLAADEAQAIGELAKPFVDALRAGTQAQEKCATRAEDEASLENEKVVSLDRLGSSVILARETVKESCNSLLDAEKTHALAEKLEALAALHYPTPYPDACLDQIDQFEAKYADLQGCSAASDCAYVGEGFTVIPYDADQVVFLEDYTKLTPIAVGNASKVTAQKAALADARQALEASCGDSFWRSPIPVEFKQFSSSAGNPVCEQGTCKVNPAVFSARRRH
jgi:hypothetical protein